MRLRTTLTLVALFCLLAGSGIAQSVRGVIGGQVTDAQSRPLPGASIRLVHEETNRVREASSSASGEFLFTLVPPGRYRLELEHRDYRKQARQVVLEVNQDIRIDLPMVPGSITEEIQVTETVALLKTESPALGAVIENSQIRALPLDGRNFYELALLLPGVLPAAPGSAGSVRGAIALNVNGAREDANGFLLDGVYNGDPKLNSFGVIPPVDAVREFEVASAGYDASFGRNAGAQLNVVLQSGANSFHGAAYHFLRNKVFDARNYFAPASEPDPQYIRNQFGGSISGPIVRDRTFFFADYEGRRVREGITRTTNVPTAAERAGDFSQSLLPPPVDPFTGQPFSGGRIPGERLHPIGQGIAALYPLPNRAVPGQNFVSSPSLRDRDDHFDARVDHHLGQGSDLFVRYSFAERSLFEPFSGPLFASVPGFGTNVPRRGQNVVVSETHTFSPAFLNEVRAGFNRVAAGSFHQNQGRSLNRSVGLPELSANERDHGLSFVTVLGFSPLGDEYNNPQHSVTNSWQVADQVTHSRGRHLLKAGGDFRVLQQNAFRDVQSRGFITFLGLTGNALAELLQGLPSLSGGARLDNHQHLRSRSYSLFVQDNWRLRSNLTLFAGLRYEYNTPPVDAEDRANVFDAATGTLVRVGTAGIPRAGFEADRNNFAPRIGLAWMPGSRGTVLRAGYGIYYDQSSLAPGEGLYFNQPYFDLKLYFPLVGIPGLPTIPLLLHDPFPANFPFALPSSALAFQRDLRSPYMQTWNFSIQQQLGRKRVLEAAYVGSKGTHLLTARDINQPRPSAARPNPRPLPQFDDITQLESRASSTYNSFQVRLHQRLDRGITLLSAYTFSKSLDDASSFFSSSGDPNFPQDSLNLRAERGRSNFDIRHRLSLAYTCDLPLGRGGPLHVLRTGWQTNGVLSFQSGRPFTVALHPDFDNSNTGRANLGFGFNDRPHLLRNPKLDEPTPERWFDTSAFAVPAFGTFGNSGRNIVEGPAHHSVNLSVLKNTSLGETTTLQLRAEAFNIFNRPNLDLPDIFVGSPSFGRISSAQSPRRVQFGVKLLF